MELADQYEATVAALKAKAREPRIRNPVKLLQAARASVPGANLRLAQLALEDSVSNKCSARPICQRGGARQKVQVSASWQTS